MIVGFIGGVVGFGYASFKKPVYHATLNFLLNENESSMPISLSSLAGLAGLGGGGTNVSDDKMMFLAGSRFLLGNTLLCEKAISGKKDFMANHFIDMNKMIDGFSADTALKGFTYFKHNVLNELTYQENKVLDKIIKRITDDKMLVITSKKKTGLVAQSSGIVILEFESGSEEFSKLFVEELYDRLSSYYVNKSTQRQLHNYGLIKERADSLKLLVEQVENTGAEYYDRNINVVKMTTRVNIERLRKNAELLNLMYAEVLKNLEIAKFSLENQTPFFQLIDSPTYPLEVKKLSRMKAAILVSVISVLIASIYILIKTIIDKSKPTRSNSSFSKSNV